MWGYRSGACIGEFFSFASPLQSRFTLACHQARTHPCEHPWSPAQVPAPRCLAVDIAGAHQPVRVSWQVLHPVPSQADNYHLPDSVVMSPGAHCPSKQFTRQILQQKRSPTEGPGRMAVPVMDA